MNGTSETKPKTPARPAEEIRADIERERAAMNSSFDKLRGELYEAVDAGRRRAEEIGRKARVIAPIAAGLTVTALAARALIRRRRSSEE